MRPDQLISSTTVYLVGAGPGDPGLLTCAGAEALRQADVCIYDYLANPRLLDLLPPGCQRVYVGKSAGQHTLSQEQINRLLVTTAQEQAAKFPHRTTTIVRLKGGDPFIFGRGGEEAQVLHEAQIPFVVIPGITSGIAGPAYAGIPATQRNLATTVTLVTGHESEDKGGGTPTLNVATLSNLLADGGTVVFYMGVRNLADIARQVDQFLKQHAETNKVAYAPLPVAVIQWATHPHQRTVVGDLSNIAQRIAEAGIQPPAIIIMGQVVNLRSTMNWFETRPLFGQRVLVTRTRQQASELATGLTQLGAQVLEAPTIEVAAPDDWTSIDKILLASAAAPTLTPPFSEWLIFTSANGVQAAWNRLRQLGLDARSFAHKGVAAIGPATSAALEKIGIAANLIPEDFNGEQLAQTLLTQTHPDPSLPLPTYTLLHADIARPTLREALQQAGAVVRDVPIYRTIKPQALPASVLQALQDDKIDWITFTSASTARNLYDLLPENLRVKVLNARRLSIGPQTTAMLRELNWAPTMEASRHDIPGMLLALQQFMTKN